LDYAAIIEELRGILVDSKDEEALVRYFLAINHENLELITLKLKTDEELEVYSRVPEESDIINFSDLNIIQIAAALDMSDTAIGYFLRKH
jgi:hypothetical protein